MKTAVASLTAPKSLFVVHCLHPNDTLQKDEGNLSQPIWKVTSSRRACLLSSLLALSAELLAPGIQGISEGRRRAQYFPVTVIDLTDHLGNTSSILSHKLKSLESQQALRTILSYSRPGLLGYDEIPLLLMIHSLSSFKCAQRTGGWDDSATAYLAC